MNLPYPSGVHSSGYIDDARASATYLAAVTVLQVARDPNATTDEIADALLALQRIDRHIPRHTASGNDAALRALMRMAARGAK